MPKDDTEWIDISDFKRMQDDVTDMKDKLNKIHDCLMGDFSKSGLLSEHHVCKGRIDKCEEKLGEVVSDVTSFKGSIKGINAMWIVLIAIVTIVLKFL